MQISAVKSWAVEHSATGSNMQMSRTSPIWSITGLLTCLSSLICTSYRGLKWASLRGPIRGSQTPCTGSPCDSSNPQVTLYLRRLWASQGLFEALLPDCPTYAHIQTTLASFICTFETFSGILSDNITTFVHVSVLMAAKGPFWPE